MRKHLKKLWLLLVPAAFAGSLFILDQNGKPVDSNNFDVKPITFNGQEITFTCADDNTNETAVIKTDKCTYSSWDTDYSYFSVSNISPDSQNYQIQFLDNNGARADFDEYKSQVPYEIDVDDYGTNKIECKDVWKENKMEIGDIAYSCGEDKPIFCTKVEGTTCIQDNVIIGSHKETRYRDEWGKITKSTPDESLKEASLKPIDSKFKPKDQIQYWIDSGETKYFRAKIKLGVKTEGKFYIIAKGSLSSFGSLDPAWYSNSWNYRIPITVDYTKIGTTTPITSFPILFSTTTLTTLKATSSSGHVGRADGLDMVVTDSDGTTTLPYEMEKYSSTTGETVLWFQTSTSTPISTSTNSTYYLYYGNAAASDQSNKTAVWDTNYKGVWHLGENSGVITKDSTSNPDNGTLTSSPSWTTGVTGPAIDFTSAGYVTIPNAAKLQISNNITAECWMYVTNTSTNRCMGKVVSDYSFEVVVSAASQWFYPEFKIGGTLYTSNTAWPGGPGGLNPFLNSWVHVVGTYDGSNIRLFVNGVQRGIFAVTGVINTTSDAMGIGARGGDGSLRFNSKVDEVRVSNYARSADWIKTEYNNQSSPSTFAMGGVEETNAVSGTPAVPEVIIDGSVILNSNVIIN